MGSLSKTSRDVKIWKAEGFDDAVIGVSFSNGCPRIVYDSEIMISILRDRDDMSYDDAIEFLEYNTFHTWMGEGTPIYIMPVTSMDDANEIIADLTE